MGDRRLDARHSQGFASVPPPAASRIFQECATLAIEGGDLLKPVADQLGRASRRLIQPMRLAVVGQIKRGKSTLVNALLGEEIASTGQMELTFTVSEFSYANGRSVFVYYTDGTVEGPLPPDALDDRVVRDPAVANHLRKIRKVEYTSPNGLLRAFRLVDTPGLGSVHLISSQNASDFLGVSPAFAEEAEWAVMQETLTAMGRTARDVHVDTVNEVDQADAMLYLFSRGLHEEDFAAVAQFLGPAPDNVSPLRAFGVLSRCDQYWPPGRDLPGNPDPVTYNPMTLANVHAEQYMADSSIRRLFFTVVPVAGLVGIGACLLTGEEFGWLDDLRTVEPSLLARRLSDLGRFATQEIPDLPLPVAMRRRLTDRLGAWGIHLACSYLRDRLGEDEIRDQLMIDSGVVQMRRLITEHFGNRASIIKLDHGIHDVTVAIGRCRPQIHQTGGHAAETVDIIADRIERLRISEYDAAAELSVLSALYAGQLTLREEETAEILAVTGEHGTTWTARLNLAEEAPLEELVEVARRLAAKWALKEIDSTPNRATVLAARTIRRSYERIAAGIEGLRKPRSEAGGDMAQSIGSGVIYESAKVGDLNSLGVTAPQGELPTAVPGDIESFVGRHAELEYLQSILHSREPNVIVISGMGGSGKTALSLHAAHSVVELYPDGLIWVSLTDHRGKERTPAIILELLLQSLGVPSDLMQPDLESRISLYRSLLDRRQVLIVLDDATSVQQIQPFLPPDSSSVVMITSRRSLISLYGVGRVELDVFTPVESVDLLKRIVGPRAVAEPDALRAIAKLCGNLPLAISIIGAHLRARPHVSATALAAELAGMPRRLDSLDSWDTSVRTAFDISYSQLDKAPARAFRMLSLFPGGTFDAQAAAALLDGSDQLTVNWLAELADRHLISRQANRYRYHDLLRTFAKEVGEGDAPDERAAALARMRKWYMQRTRRAVTLVTTAAEAESERGLRDEALAWLEDERNNMLSIAAEAAATKEAKYVSDLADVLYPFYDLRGHWVDCQAIHELALQVARSAQDNASAQRILNSLGVAYREQHQYAACVSCLEESVALSEMTGSKETSTLALMNLGVAHHVLGQFSAAISCFESALSLSRELRLDTIIRQTLRSLGNAYYDMSCYDDAWRAYREALELCRSARDLRGEGIGLASLGTLYQVQGFPNEAIDCFTRSLEIAKEIFDPVSEGRALRNLGAAYAARGNINEAISTLDASVQIAERVQDVDTLYLASLGLGDIYLSCDNTREAKNWYETCRIAAKEIGDIQREARAVKALGDTVNRDHETELALAYYNDTADLLRDSLDRRGLASALLSTGSALTSLRRARDALSCFEEAAAIARDLGDPSVELASLRLLIDVVHELGQESDASAIRQRIDEIGDHPAHLAQENG